MTKMTGAQHLAGVLQGYEVDHVFFVPAALLTTLAEMENMPIRRIVTHGEKSAAYMADGYARASGKPGICFAQNIGASNLAAGLRDAYMACVPVIAITGGPSAESRHRNYYQEIEDFPQFDAVTKFNGQVDAIERLPDLVRQAFREATSGTPRPVHLRLPGVTADDLMNTEAELPIHIEDRFKRMPAFRPPANPDQITEAIGILMSAERPVLVAGGGVVTSGAQAELLQLATQLNIPLATSLNAKGTIPDNHPLSLGVVGTYSRSSANKALAEADLVFFVGSQTGGQVTTRWNVPSRATKIIHLDINPSELGRNYPNTTPILGDAKVVLAQILEATRDAKANDNSTWHARIQGLSAEWRQAEEAALNSIATPIRPERLCHEISKALPEDAIVVSDTGHSGMWSGVMIDFFHPTQRYIRCAGSLGWGLPGALGVKCAVPDRPVVCFTGDGAAYYHLAELETAVRYNINVVVIVNNNNALNQEVQLYDAAYGGERGPRSDELWRFTEVSFADMARTMGCESVRVEDPSKIAEALEWAFAVNRPVVVEVMTDIWAEAQNAWTP